MGRRGRRVGLVLAVAAMAGCGGHAAKNDGAAGAGAGAGGGVGVGGSAGGLAGGGTSGGLPACAIAARPSDPTGASPCNTIVYGGSSVPAEAFEMTDGGLRADGGVFEAAGGTILDGDYDLVRYWSNFTPPTRRSIRIFDGGAFIEWLMELRDADGGSPTDARFNTSQTPSSSVRFVLTTTCDEQGIMFRADYDYAVAGNDLLLFGYQLDTGALLNAYTYRRTCAR